MAKKRKPKTSAVRLARKSAGSYSAENYAIQMTAYYEQIVAEDKRRLATDEGWLAYWKSQIPKTA